MTSHNNGRVDTPASQSDSRLGPTDGDSRTGSEEGGTRAVRLTMGVSANVLSKGESHRRLQLHTGVYYYAFFVVGWLVGQRGAAFLDLLLVTQTDLHLGSLLFTLAGFASITGVLAGGLLLDFTRRPVILVAGALVLTAALNVAISVSTLFPLVGVLHFSAHVAMASIDVVVNSVMANLWGQKGRGYMQFLHFTFSFGAVLSPLATKPFLAPKAAAADSPFPIQHNQTFSNQEGHENETLDYLITESGLVDKAMPTAKNYMENVDSLSGSRSNVSYYFEILRLNQSSFNNESSRGTNLTQGNLNFSGQSQVFYAFLISAILCVSAAFVVLILCCFPIRKKKDPKENVGEKGQRKTRFKEKLMGFKLLALVLICAHCFLASYIRCPDYLMTFVVRGLNWTKASGATLTSVFWVGLAVGRLSGVGLVRVLTPAQILSGCLVMLLLSFLGLLLAVLFRVQWTVWLCSAAVGLFVAMLFPTMMTYTNENVMPMTGRLGALIFTMAMGASLLYPLLLTHLMALYSSTAFVYVFLAKTALALLCFGLVHAIVRTNPIHPWQRSERELGTSDNLQHGDHTDEEPVEQFLDRRDTDV